MNINLYTEEQFRILGMQRIIGSVPAVMVIQLVRKKLFKFGIELNKHVVATVNHRASIMVKYDVCIRPELYYAHGIHLVLCDIHIQNTQAIYIDITSLYEDEYLIVKLKLLMIL